VGVARLQAEGHIQVRWTPFPLHPETPEEGISLEELFAGRGFNVDAMMARLRAVAEGVGLPLGSRRRTYNSRRAQELGKWAEEQGRGEAFRSAAFRAYFVDGRNLALIEELAQIATAAGLDGTAARRVVGAGEFAPAVDADWSRARSMGISAVPTHLLGDRASSGFQPYEELREFVAAARGASLPPGGRAP